MPKKQDKGKESKEFRTSTQARLDRTESLMLREIDERISRLTKVPAPHNEQVQILRYEKTQYYAAHLDNWDPAFYTTEGSEFIEHGHNNRLITVFWYLTDVSEGGDGARRGAAARFLRIVGKGFSFAEPWTPRASSKRVKDTFLRGFPVTWKRARGCCLLNSNCHGKWCRWYPRSIKS